MIKYTTKHEHKTHLDTDSIIEYAAHDNSDDVNFKPIEHGFLKRNGFVIRKMYTGSSFYDMYKCYINIDHQLVGLDTEKRYKFFSNMVFEYERNERDKKINALI